jgi:hypothetical protein
MMILPFIFFTSISSDMIGVFIEKNRWLRSLSQADVASCCIEVLVVVGAGCWKTKAKEGERREAGGQEAPNKRSLPLVLQELAPR